MTDLPVKTKPPHNISVLQRWLGEAARLTGVPAYRLQSWVGFMVVAAMLDVAQTDGEPLFLVKGGVAMELRAGTGARATRDLDAAYRGDLEALDVHLDAAVLAGYGDFTAIRTPLGAVRDTGASRCDIKLAYRSRSFATVQLELAGIEAGMGDEVDRLAAHPLTFVGVTGPETVPCVAVRWQIAQKLHACTETFATGENQRFRDLLDLQLLEALVPSDGWTTVRAACVEVFEHRAKQSWPPELTVPGSWREGYRRMAVRGGLPGGDVDEAAAAVRSLIERIDTATTT